MKNTAKSQKIELPPLCQINEKYFETITKDALSNIILKIEKYQVQHNDPKENVNIACHLLKDHFKTDPKTLSEIFTSVKSALTMMGSDFYEYIIDKIIIEKLGGEKTDKIIKGIDYKVNPDVVTYIVSVKSSANWSNTSSMSQQITDFNNYESKLNDHKKIKKIILQSTGDPKSTIKNDIITLTGAETWKFLTGNKNYYNILLNTAKSSYQPQCN